MKNIIFDLGGVVVEWNAKRVIETFRGNPILVNFVRENRLFLNDWRDYDRGDVTRQELINKVAILSGCPPEDCNEFVEHVKHSLVSIPETETLIKELYARGFKLYCLSNMSVDFYELPENTGSFQVLRRANHIRPRTHGETRPGNLRLDSKSLSFKTRRVSVY